jgi:hypothetical protein
MTTNADLRQHVRQRAGARWQYCRKPEVASAYPHHIEHIIARKHAGSSAPGNLAWACFHCNVAKGSDIASYDPETQQLTPLFNPRIQPWREHFEVVDMYHSVGGIVATGAVLVRGGSVLIREKFSASEFWDDIVRRDGTLFQYIGELWLPAPQRPLLRPKPGIAFGRAAAMVSRGRLE